MDRQNMAYLAFNRGLISRLALARADVKRASISAQVFVNYAPRVLGSMMLRPGLVYKAGIKNNAAERLLEFVFSTSDKALIELTDSNMRVLVNDTPITRPAVATAIAGGTFPSAASLAANWSDDDEVGGTSTWVAAGQVGFNGDGVHMAARTQHVTVNPAYLGVEHALKIHILRGPLDLRVGTTAGDDDLISQATLGTGWHSLAFTPLGVNVYIRFQSRLDRQSYLAFCDTEGVGDMNVTTPWAAANLSSVRKDQSADVLYIACSGMQQYKIERRATHSWSVVKYEPEDGPFRTMNVGPITLAPGVLTGEGALVASAPLFRSGHVGSLWALTSTGQGTSKTVNALNDATPSIRVEGVGTDRAITVVLSSLTGSGDTVILERSFDNATWVSVAGKSWVADTAEAYTDGLDNQIVYYRLLCSVYVGGTHPQLAESIPTGTVRGIVKLTAVANSTNATMQVLRNLGSTTATADWEEGKWSDYRGWPTSVRLHEGRLNWNGKDTAALSVSDGFESYDPTVVGDSGPILRSIGSGPVDTIEWALSLKRLILGGQGAEFVAKASTLDEPLTPTNFNLKRVSGQGTASVQALELDTSGIYVQRGGTRVFELQFDPSTYDYTSVQLSALIPEIGQPGISRMAVQRQPDTRVHFVRTDGTVAVLLFDRVESVNCWFEVETQGYVEDVAVLPGDSGVEEDQVYYVVRRVINGATVRYLERWALESESIGAAMNKQADAAYVYSGVPKAVITGLTWLEGAQVVVWADGVDVGHDANDALIYTVTGGTIQIPAPASNICVGLPYTAQWQSGKLLELTGSVPGLALKDQKNIQNLGLILADVHRKGLKFGPDFDHLDDLPSIEGGAPVGDDEVRVALDENWIIFPGTWDVDSRLCLQSIAPRPATVLAAVCAVENH